MGTTNSSMQLRLYVLWVVLRQRRARGELSLLGSTYGLSGPKTHIDGQRKCREVTNRGRFEQPSPGLPKQACMTWWCFSCQRSNLNYNTEQLGGALAGQQIFYAVLVKIQPLERMLTLLDI